MLHTAPSLTSWLNAKLVDQHLINRLKKISYYGVTSGRDSLPCPQLWCQLSAQDHWARSTKLWRKVAAAAAEEGPEGLAGPADPRPWARTRKDPGRLYDTGTAGKWCLGLKTSLACCRHLVKRKITFWNQDRSWWLVRAWTRGLNKANLTTRPNPKTIFG